MMMARKLLGAGFLLFAALPAVAAPEEQPAVTAGSTIVGDQDASLGLYIAPWQEEGPLDLDRPPRFSPRESDAEFNAEAFRRQIEFDESRRAYRRARVERTR